MYVLKPPLMAIDAQKETVGRNVYSILNVPESVVEIVSLVKV